MALTRDAIWQAADTLDAEGIKPTLSAVRKKVGSGSFTTIQDAMTEWKLRRQQAAAATVEPPPPEIAERSLAFAGELWTWARQAADLALTGERQRMDAERADLRNQVAEAVELADSLQAEIERQRNELKTLRAHRAAHDQAVADLAEVKRKAGEEINRTMEKATRKDSEAIEARKGERAALDRAAKAEGQAEALKGQLAALTAALRPPPASPKMQANQASGFPSPS